MKMSIAAGSLLVWTTMRRAVSFSIPKTAIRTGSFSSAFLLSTFTRYEMTSIGHCCQYQIGSTRLFATKKKSKKNEAPPKKKHPKSFPKKKNDKTLRADRVLSNRGWGSRSECFDLLKKGRVAIKQENGELVRLKGPSERVLLEDTLYVNGVPVPPIPLLVVYYKPKWVLSVMKDPKGRDTIETALPPHLSKQLHPVGRLDYDTSGLLLFSSNGKLTQRLLHPHHHVEKEYVALVEGKVDETALRDQLARGVETTEGNHTAQLLQVTHLDPADVPQLLQDIKDTLPEEYNVTDLELRGYLSTATELSEVRLVVKEGKHRMVRRVLANCGHGVVELKRERLGIIELTGDLREGEHRMVTEQEEEWVKELLQTKRIKS